MYSPTLLDTRRDQLIYFPRNPDHIFYIWGNPDRIVHRHDSGVKNWHVMYNSYEISDSFVDQYGTNVYRDLSNLNFSLSDLPFPIRESELGREPQPQSEAGYVSEPS